MNKISQQNKDYYLKNKAKILKRKQEYYRENKDEIKIKMKKYRETEKGKSIRYNNVVDYQKRFPKKRQTRTKLLNLFKNGNINNNHFICSICGKQPIEKHHENYDEPFIFIPLCKFHHNKIHKE